MGKTAGTDESVFRQVALPGNGARVLPLEVVPCPGTLLRFLLGHQQKAMARLMPVPENRGRAPSLPKCSHLVPEH